MLFLFCANFSQLLNRGGAAAAAAALLRACAELAAHKRGNRVRRQ